MTGCAAGGGRIGGHGMTGAGRRRRGRRLAVFGIHSDRGYTEIVKGIRIKTLVSGDETLMTEFVMAEGSVLPEHKHVHEQTGYLVRGKMKLKVSGLSRIIMPGDSWCVPPNALHGAEVLEDSLAVEVFSPYREEYARYLDREDVAGAD
jgi:quercetin dioxygenase-like cupin family protein